MPPHLEDALSLPVELIRDILELVTLNYVEDGAMASALGHLRICPAAYGWLRPAVYSTVSLYSDEMLRSFCECALRAASYGHAFPTLYLFMFSVVDEAPPLERLPPVLAALPLLLRLCIPQDRCRAIQGTAQSGPSHLLLLPNSKASLSDAWQPQLSPLTTVTHLILSGQPAAHFTSTLAALSTDFPALTHFALVVNIAASTSAHTANLLTGGTSVPPIVAAVERVLQISRVVRVQVLLCGQRPLAEGTSTIGTAAFIYGSNEKLAGLRDERVFLAVEQFAPDVTVSSGMWALKDHMWEAGARVYSIVQSK